MNLMDVPMVNDIIANAIAQMALNVLTQAASRLRSDREQKALAQVFQSGLEHMVRASSSGLSEAEVDHIVEAFGKFLEQPDVIQTLLDVVLDNVEPDIGLLTTRFYSVSPADSLLNISFDLRTALLELNVGLYRALISEAKSHNSPLAGYVLVARVETVLRQDQVILERIEAISISSQMPGTIHNSDVHKPVTQIAICRSLPTVIYSLIGGTVFLTQDGARTWRPLQVNAGCLAAHPAQPNTVLSIRTDGLYVSENYGEDWFLRSAAVRWHAFSGGHLTIHPHDANRLVYANNVGVHTSLDGGRTWRTHAPPQRRGGSSGTWHSAIDINSTDLVVAVFYEQPIYSTVNWGESWEMMSGPVTGDYLHPGLSRPIVIDPGTSAIWYSDLGTYDPNDRVKLRTGLYVTPDRGNKWEFVEFGDDRPWWPVDYIEVTESIGHPMFYAGSPGCTTAFSADGGKTWTPLMVEWNGLPDGVSNCADLLGIYPVDSLRSGPLFLKTRKGLLKSIDGGRTWFY